MKQAQWRVFAAFLLSPLLPGIPLAVVTLVVGGHSSVAFTMFVTATAVSAVVTLLVAVPAYLLIRRYRKVGLVECIVAGAVIGAAIDFLPLFALPLMSTDGSSYSSGGLTPIGLAMGAVFHALLGGFIGLFFWLVAFYSERSAPVPAATAPRSADDRHEA